MRSASMRQSALRANSVVPFRAEQPFVGEVGDPGLAFGGALRRPWRQPDLAHGLGDLAHFFAAAAAMLDDALEEIGALLLPVDAGKGLLERRQHRVLDAIGARRGKTLDHHGFHALDHDAAAHLDRRGDAELVAGNLGVEAEFDQQGRKLAGAGAAQQQRHLDAVRRERGHHGALDIASAGAVDQAAARCLAPGEAELKSRNQAPGFSPGTQACATGTAWLAVTAQTIKSACAARSACDAASATPCASA